MIDPSPLLIGTAGWSIPAADAASFPAAGTHLERYATTMSAVEINSSFHRPHRRSTYERWAASTPERFRFSVKIPKAISHVRRLVDADELLVSFVEQIEGLADRLSVLLLQLPPSLAFAPGVASSFFGTLRHKISPDISIACEPRHATWFARDAEACLIEHRVARVAVDPVLAAGGERPGGWTGLRYHRLHGSPRVYYSSYGRDRLEGLAEAARGKDQAAVPSWWIFDNTAAAAATSDALCLQSLLAP